MSDNLEQNQPLDNLLKPPRWAQRHELPTNVEKLVIYSEQTHLITIEHVHRLGHTTLTISLVEKGLNAICCCEWSNGPNNSKPNFSNFVTVREGYIPIEDETLNTRLFYIGFNTENKTAFIALFTTNLKIPLSLAKQAQLQLVAQAQTVSQFKEKHSQEWWYLAEKVFDFIYSEAQGILIRNFSGQVCNYILGFSGHYSPLCKNERLMWLDHKNIKHLRQHSHFDEILKILEYDRIYLELETDKSKDPENIDDIVFGDVDNIDGV